MKSIYSGLPEPCIKVVKNIPDHLLFGKSFRSAKKSLSISNSFLNENIYKTLVYARKHTSFGKENVPEDFSIDEAQDVLAHIPCVTSEQLAENSAYYISDEANQFNSYHTTTGGSGRQPTDVLLSNESYGIEWAHMLHIWAQIGYRRSRNLKLTLRGKHLSPGQLLTYNPIYNEIVADSFQITHQNFPDFLRQLRKYKITFIHGYPSLVSLFMERLKEIGEFFPVEGIFLASEGATMNQKKDFASFFHSRIVTWYGQTEKVVLAMDPDLSGKYINFSSYGFPSLYQKDENGFGEILGTSFVNKALPLINFRTGDYAKILWEENKILLTDIQGRWGKDFVYLTSKDRIPTAAINLHSDVQRKILFYQIYQSEFAQLEIKYLLKSEYADKEKEVETELIHDLQTRLKGFDIHFVSVSDDSQFIRSHRGKKIMLVQNLKFNN